MQTDIVLTTLNSRFAHASFGLRYLLANLGELQSRSRILEFTISDRMLDVAEAILSHSPAIVGLGVYIWNARESLELVQLLKRIQPDLRVVLGGPEISYETLEQEIAELADVVVTGQADLIFPQICEDLLAGHLPAAKVIAAPVPDPNQLCLPYSLYSSQDIAHRIIYVEASRGCPFRCEFCLSSLDKGVKKYDLTRFLDAMHDLYERGVRHFKFVDRTFNIDISVSSAILQFFLDRYEPGMFVHFEMVPDRLPVELRELIAQFPHGALQFEVGIQTFNPEVAKLISRRQNYERLEDNFEFLRTQTGVHIHADLIAGLPGEDLDSFGEGFDRLVALQPQEIQVGILKRLRGTPIIRHDDAWEMVYSAQPPYEILQTKLVDFATMQRLRRFARYWDLVGNSGNFVRTTPRIWEGASPFQSFMHWSDWLFQTTSKTFGISLKRLAEHLFIYLTEVRGQDAEEIAIVMLKDYQQGGKRPDVPGFLRSHLPEELAVEVRGNRKPTALPPRQARHLVSQE